MSVFDVFFIFMILGLCVTFSGFLSKRKHLLSSLLTLEGMVLVMFVGVLWGVGIFYEAGVFVLVFLTLMACEGALGLSLLITLTRSHGSDFFSSFNSLEC